MKTKESIFAKMCNKLEADMQYKIYCEENSLDINNKANQYLFKDARNKRHLKLKMIQTNKNTTGHKFYNQ